MAMMARGLGPVRRASVRRCQHSSSGACGARAPLLPLLRAAASTPPSIVTAASQHGRNAAGDATSSRPYSALAGGLTPEKNTKGDLREPPSACMLRRVSGNFRRSFGSSGFDFRAAPAGRANPTKATARLLLPCGGSSRDQSRWGVFCPASASREWRSGGGGGGAGGVALLQLAGLRTSASVSAPADGDDKKPTTPGVQQRQQQSVDEGKTVKGGNPACREEEDGRSFIQMRERIRRGRLDASEDAKDWMRDKRDDMNTMKESLRDARQELRDARRDGRLGEELSEQAKERSGRVQVLWRQYGAVGIGTYFGIYFGSIAFFYVVYDYGVLTNLPSGGTAVIEHMQEWMKSAPEWAQGYSDRLFGAMVEDHRARSLVLAWATCKVIEPLRLLGAIAITPRMARALGRAPSKVADDEDGDDENSRGRDGEGSGVGGTDADRGSRGGGGGSG